MTRLRFFSSQWVGLPQWKSHWLWWKYPRHWLLFNENTMPQPQETAYCFYCHSVSLLQASSVQQAYLPGFTWVSSSTSWKGGLRQGEVWVVIQAYQSPAGTLGQIRGLAAPMGDGASWGDSTYWSNSFPPPAPAPLELYAAPLPSSVKAAPKTKARPSQLQPHSWDQHVLSLQRYWSQSLVGTSSHAVKWVGFRP